MRGKEKARAGMRRGPWVGGAGREREKQNGSGKAGRGGQATAPTRAAVAFTTVIKTIVRIENEQARF
jgi:hypothetical protein